MINILWVGMLLLAFLFGGANGRIDAVTGAMFEGASSAVTLTISLLGAMGLWSGFMRIADRAGVTDVLANMFSPLLRVLFPSLPRGSMAAKAICMNVSANLLGMGNAATPFGLAAMRELAKNVSADDTASDAMITFVVMNTACFQLIPSTVAVLRETAGSIEPFAIMPAVWLTSAISLTSGLTAAWLLRTGEKTTYNLRNRSRTVAKM